MIKITDDKKDEMTELVEKMLHYGGKLMTCLESLEDGESMGQRMGMRDWDDDDEDEEMGMRGNGSQGGGYGMRDGGSGYGMRRGRSSRTGRYTRY